MRALALVTVASAIYLWTGNLSVPVMGLILVAALVFAETLLLWSQFNAASAEFQFVERHAWMPAFGVSYAVGVDGISLFMVLLTTLTTPVAVVMLVSAPEMRKVSAPVPALMLANGL